MRLELTVGLNFERCNFPSRPTGLANTCMHTYWVIVWLSVRIPTPGKLIILLAQTEDLRSLRINIVELVTGLVEFSYFGQQSAHNITNKYSATKLDE